HAEEGEWLRSAFHSECRTRPNCGSHRSCEVAVQRPYGTELLPPACGAVRTGSSPMQSGPLLRRVAVELLPLESGSLLPDPRPRPARAPAADWHEGRRAVRRVAVAAASGWTFLAVYC